MCRVQQSLYVRIDVDHIKCASSSAGEVVETGQYNVTTVKRLQCAGQQKVAFQTKNVDIMGNNLHRFFTDCITFTWYVSFEKKTCTAKEHPEGQKYSAAGCQDKKTEDQKESSGWQTKQHNHANHSYTQEVCIQA